MKQPIRIIDTGLKPARWNVAMTAALAELHSQGHAPDTVRFHRYPMCVLLGRSQHIAHSADTAYCRREGIEIARRVTGGGAVFMGPRMLAWDVVVDRGAWGGGLEAVTRGICESVSDGLSRLGVFARFRAPNDIEVNGRKVSGSSGYVQGHSAVLQGTVLIENDLHIMARALRIPHTDLRAKVTWLSEVLAMAPTIRSVMDNISIGLARNLKCEPVIVNADSGELALCDAFLRDEIGTQEFVFGEPTGAAV